MHVRIRNRAQSLSCFGMQRLEKTKTKKTADAFIISSRTEALQAAPPDIVLVLTECFQTGGKKKKKRFDLLPECNQITPTSLSRSLKTKTETYGEAKIIQTQQQNMFPPT